VAIYEAWPEQTDVQSLLARANVTLRLAGAEAAEVFARTLRAVPAELESETGRQFVATADVRTYDGSGTPEIEVDEMVSLSGVAILDDGGDLSYALDGAQLAREQGKPRTRILLDRGSLGPGIVDAGRESIANRDYVLPSVYIEYVVPVGRRNVEVTGVFGYDRSIPPDVWEAVAAECALRLASEASWRPAGNVAEVRSGDNSVRYAATAPTLTGWHDLFRAAMRRHKRPAGRRLRRLRPAVM
jgi:hypothetical protein